MQNCKILNLNSSCASWQQISAAAVYNSTGLYAFLRMIKDSGSQSFSIGGRVKIKQMFTDRQQKIIANI